jgi:hypothetical protein
MANPSASIRVVVFSVLGLLLSSACGDSGQGATAPTAPSTSPGVGAPSNGGVPVTPAPGGDNGAGVAPGNSGMPSMGAATETPDLPRPALSAGPWAGRRG